jgi:ferric-dicitrate binding protein FerR (iron transport regulator)
MEKEKLYRFFEGTASLAEEREIRKWLDDAPANERVLLNERKLFDLVALAPLDGQDGVEGLRVKRRRFVRELLKAAAVALLVLAGSYMYGLFGEGSGAMAMQTVSVPAGQRVNLSLPDGSNVWLNARTRLTYPAGFSRTERVVALEGEAYFEVVADAKRPFVVKTSKGQVTALGTKFNVEDYSGTDAFETTLMSGKVAVESKRDPSGRIILAPGQKAVSSGGKLHAEDVGSYSRYRWVEGLICFEGESFLMMMKEFEKYYGVSIRVENHALEKYIFTGKFRHTDGVDYALRVLQRDVRFRYERDDEQQVIYIK